MGVSEERRRDCSRGVQALAYVQVGSVVPRLAIDALVARPAEVLDVASVGLTMRLISSQSFQPTSPIQISVVPGLNVNRNGFRNPSAIMRRAFGSALPASGLFGRPLPVVGSTRITVPSRFTGSPVVRESWLRSAPPSAVGGAGAVPTGTGGSPQGLTGVGPVPPPCP